MALHLSDGNSLKAGAGIGSLYLPQDLALADSFVEFRTLPSMIKNYWTENEWIRIIYANIEDLDWRQMAWVWSLSLCSELGALLN